MTIELDDSELVIPERGCMVDSSSHVPESLVSDGFRLLFPLLLQALTKLLREPANLLCMLCKLCKLLIFQVRHSSRICWTCSVSIPIPRFWNEIAAPLNASRSPLIGISSCFLPLVLFWIDIVSIKNDMNAHGIP